jgi:hypothetical protein
VPRLDGDGPGLLHRPEYSVLPLRPGYDGILRVQTAPPATRKRHRAERKLRQTLVDCQTIAPLVPASRAFGQQGQPGEVVRARSQTQHEPSDDTSRPQQADPRMERMFAQAVLAEGERLWSSPLSVGFQGLVV